MGINSFKKRSHSGQLSKKVAKIATPATSTPGVGTTLPYRKFSARRHKFSGPIFCKIATTDRCRILGTRTPLPPAAAATAGMVTAAEMRTGDRAARYAVGKIARGRKLESWFPDFAVVVNSVSSHRQKMQNFFVSAEPVADSGSRGAAAHAGTEPAEGRRIHAGREPSRIPPWRERRPRRLREPRRPARRGPSCNPGSPRTEIQ